MVALALSLSVGFGRTEAAPITLFSTGVDGSNNALPAGSVDPHYVLTSSDDPAWPIPDAHVVGTPPATWVPNNTTPGASAQWIAPNPVQVGDVAAPGNAAGSYVYEVTFDLGPNPSQESITGEWAASTYGLLFLNGVYVGNSTNLNGPTQLTPFSVPSTANFVSGVNKLDFVVVNAAQGATGLYVGAISGSYTPGIPEPSSVVLAGLGIAGMLVYRWRRGRTK